MLWDQMYSFLKGWFDYPGITWELMLVAIGLAILFGAFWLAGYWPPVFKKVWFWPVMIASAFLTLLAITFVQIPVQYYSSQAMQRFWDQETLTKWYLLTGIPIVLASGLVQEAIKSLPVAVWWRRSGKTMTPKMGLMIGAAAGAGFGIFEAVWNNGGTFAAGWTTQLFSQYGFESLYSFIVRFFVVAFHIGSSALLGYGLVKGKWWQYFLITAVLHSLLNYSAILITYLVLVKQVEWLEAIHAEAYIAVIAIAVMVWALILRWRKDQEEPLLPLEIPVEPVEPVQPAEATLPPSVDMMTPPGA